MCCMPLNTQSFDFVSKNFESGNDILITYTKSIFKISEVLYNQNNEYKYDFNSCQILSLQCGALLHQLSHINSADPVPKRDVLPSPAVSWNHLSFFKRQCFKPVVIETFYLRVAPLEVRCVRIEVVLKKFQAEEERLLLRLSPELAFMLFLHWSGVVVYSQVGQMRELATSPFYFEYAAINELKIDNDLKKEKGESAGIRCAKESQKNNQSVSHYVHHKFENS
ncbi:Hypothetical_protein [Hexamita inflata]|uniref:Hypothetical_protein n=1 Tax=Hexamita inflata TaxID=28002 RepID=A0AA86R371_9EUKA|nr:Hypothetical protein HINF_LOCUS58536 [Hexamita inflata]